MSGPNPVTGPAVPRRPAVAGAFYPDDPAACRGLARAFLDDAPATPPGPWLGGIVPHAGWVCSGAIAGRTIAAIARDLFAGPRDGNAPGGGIRSGTGVPLPVGAAGPDLVVVFAAVHTPGPLERGALDTHSGWALPSGTSPVHLALRTRLADGYPDLFVTDDSFHARDHAVEVELPLIQAAWADVPILPVEVPLIESAPRIGRAAARAARELGIARPVFLASSDLTHYGPAYGFAPAGVGQRGLDWALANDRRLLDLAVAGATDQIVPEVAAHLNACGGGAVAALLAACHAWTGIPPRGHLLVHANSCQTLARTHPQPPTNAVGYASLVVA